MFTPAPGKPYIEPKITVNGARLDVVDTFVSGKPSIERQFTRY